MTMLEMMHILQAQVCGCISAHPRSGVTRGKGVHLPPGAEFWGQKIEVGMLCNNYEISKSADVNNYDFQNFECQLLIPS